MRKTLQASPSKGCQARDSDWGIEERSNVIHTWKSELTAFLWKLNTEQGGAEETIIDMSSGFPIPSAMVFPSVIPQQALNVWHSRC